MALKDIYWYECYIHFFLVSYVQAIRTFKHKKEHLLAFFEMKGKDVSKIGNKISTPFADSEGGVGGDPPPP